MRRIGRSGNVPARDGDACTVSYWMNALQSLHSREPFVVTLNRTDAIDPARVLARMRYAHPVYTAASVAAQQRRAEIDGVDRLWFAGAYWGWGFHEDGLRSAAQVAESRKSRTTNSSSSRVGTRCTPDVAASRSAGLAPP